MDNISINQITHNITQGYLELLFFYTKSTIAHFAYLYLLFPFGSSLVNKKRRYWKWWQQVPKQEERPLLKQKKLNCAVLQVLVKDSPKAFHRHYLFNEYNIFITGQQTDYARSKWKRRWWPKNIKDSLVGEWLDRSSCNTGCPERLDKRQTTMLSSKSGRAKVAIGYPDLEEKKI